jgi:hypothetical protein
MAADDQVIESRASADTAPTPGKKGERMTRISTLSIIGKLTKFYTSTPADLEIWLDPKDIPPRRNVMPRGSTSINRKSTNAGIR